MTNKKNMLSRKAFRNFTTQKSLSLGELALTLITIVMLAAGLPVILSITALAIGLFIQFILDRMISNR